MNKPKSYNRSSPLILIIFLSLLLSGGCVKAFKKKPSSPPQQPREAAPVSPREPSSESPSPQQPVPQPPARQEIPPLPEPAEPSQPEARKPVLPSDSAASQLLSQAWDDLGKGRMDLAEMRFEKVLRLSPSYGAAYLGLAQISYKRQEYERCIEFVQSAEIHSYNDSSLLLEIYALEGDCYQRMGKRDKAEMAYRKGLEVDPSNEILAAKLKKLKR